MGENSDQVGWNRYWEDSKNFGILFLKYWLYWTSSLFLFFLSRITRQTERSDLIITAREDFIKPARQAPEEGDDICWHFSYPLILIIRKILNLWLGIPSASLALFYYASLSLKTTFHFPTKDKYNLCNLIIKFIPDPGSVQVPHYPMELECTEMHKLFNGFLIFIFNHLWLQQIFWFSMHLNNSLWPF